MSSEIQAIKEMLQIRSNLQELRDAAAELAVEIPNEHWKRAYLNLSDAADKLDAMEARTIDVDETIIE